MQKFSNVDYIVFKTDQITFTNGIGFIPYDYGIEYAHEPICVAIIQSVDILRVGMNISTYTLGRIEIYSETSINGQRWVSYVLGLSKA